MFHDQDYITLEQLELNNPHHPLPNTSSFPFPFQLDGIHDLLFAADGALNAPARPSVPLIGSVPLQPQTVVMRSAGGGHKRPTRKGRHSKICTAAGPRDRRMRLSIDVARSFFRLQDMLGFDKASKTVQWLLTMSKVAIKELASSVSSSKICSSSSDRSPKSESSTLACEASSSTNKAATSAAAASKAKKTRAKKEAAKATKKPEYHSAQARELRAKARERARERTKEKQRIMTTNAINFDAIKDEAGLQDFKTLLEFANDEGGQGLNTGCEEAYGYPMIGGPPPVLIPILGNGPTPPPATVAAATANNNTSGNIFEEQWEMEALSLYSRSLQVAFSNYPN